MQTLPQTGSTRSDTTVNPAVTTQRALPVEGRSPLSPGQSAAGQVISSEPVRQGQGYQINIQLPSGEQLTLRSDRPMQEGQWLQLQARNDGLMDVRPLSTTALQHWASQLLAQSPQTTLQLAPGQTLPPTSGLTLLAEVTSSQTNPQGKGYQINLQLANGQTLQLLADTPLKPGQPVSLAINADGTLQTRLLTQETASLLALLNTTSLAATRTDSGTTQAPTSLQTLLESASAQLRQALPRQAPLAQSMQALQQLLRQLPEQPASQTTTPVSSGNASQSSTTASLPSLKEHLTALLQLLPQGDKTPSATSLQQFIPFSGLLLEANLARGVQTQPASGDLKLLLQLASAQLRQNTGLLTGLTPRQQQVLQQIAQHLQAAEARTQVLQQTSLQATQATHERGQPGQVLQMDLPYSVRGDWYQAQLEIRRWIEEKDAEAAREEVARTRCWEVRLSFDLKQWGKIHVFLRLQGEALNADLWAESSETYPLLDEQAELLASRLRRIGAEVERVDCHLGEPPKLMHAAPKNQIIDTRI